MRTLDEVIKALELFENTPLDCAKKCPYAEECQDRDQCFCCEREADALHYLKDYRDSKEWLELEKRNYAEAVKNCDQAEVKYTKHVLELNRNDPLTWDELKKKKGKPVWVERPEWKEWLLVSEIDNDKCEMFLRDKWGNGVSVNGRNIGYWQAYRKERREDL